MLIRRSCGGLLILLSVWVLSGGCENALNPFSGGAGAFTIYGFVDVGSTRQFIRVHDMTTPLTPQATRTIDATVTLKNLDTGTTTRLRDSVIVFDGLSTHNFWADVDVQPGTRYRVIAEGPEGRTSTATTTTPVTGVEMEPASGHCLTQFLIWFRAVQDARRVQDVAFGFEHDGERVWMEHGPPLPPDGNDVHLALTPESLIDSEIPSQDDLSTPSQYEPRCLALSDNRIYIRYTHLGRAWERRVEDVEDYDPTQSRFVTNGRGFFGGLRRDTVAVTVDTSSALDARP